MQTATFWSPEGLARARRRLHPESRAICGHVTACSVGSFPQLRACDGRTDFGGDRRGKGNFNGRKTSVAADAVNIGQRTFDAFDDDDGTFSTECLEQIACGFEPEAIVVG